MRKNKLRLYPDTCFYCRPFDNQEHRSQESVEAEIIAIKGVVELCKALGFDIIGSPAVEMEIEKNKTGDFTAEKYDRPEESMEDIAAELRRITAEHLLGADNMAAGRLAGKVVI